MGADDCGTFGVMLFEHTFWFRKELSKINQERARQTGRQQGAKFPWRFWESKH